MINNYLLILQDSLIKKLDLLKQVEAKSLEQAEMLKEQKVNLALIDANMEEKAKLIDSILALDDGFESIYEKIRVQLQGGKEQYKHEISILQGLIEKVTEKSTSIQALEARNKVQMDMVFSKQKKELQSRKNAMSVAKDYYQTMNKVKYVSPQFLDKKK